MKQIILLLTCIVFLHSHFAFSQEIDISSGWKFKKGDDMKWTDLKLDDKDWKDIEVNRYWETQGYEKQDGYGWYRKKVFIPSSLKKNSSLKDSIKILLGIIDDHDQVYLNGKMIGQNAGLKFEFGNNLNDAENSAYNKERKYVVSTKHPALLWDKENIIAVRVYDQMGNGGMGKGSKYSISMVDLIDYVVIDHSSSSFNSKADGTFSKEINLISSGPVNLKFKGKLVIEITDLISGKVIQTLTSPASFSKNAPFRYEFTTPKGENYIANYIFEDAKFKNRFSEKQEIPFILTPKEEAKAKINGPKIFGVRPGSPFLFTIPASGERPITFTVEGLPKGLQVDPKTGIITGSVNEIGEYKLNLVATNSKGKDVKPFKIVVGDKISLTPPMGWNSWNCWGLAVSDEKVRSSAKAMVDKGLINYGWSYMNIDDGWEGKRDEKGVLQTNEKFPDMKKLANDIHNMGLKLGIYSSPGPKTCGGYEGSYKFEETDIKTWADWGIDYLKYDWCSYSDIFKVKMDNEWNVKTNDPEVLAGLKKPYQVMQKAITAAPRDMVYSLCQYGWGDVWNWGEEVNGQCWRTTGDIEDSWNSLVSIGFSQIEQHKNAKPGRWNDPDMLVVGKVGWGPSLRNSRLTVNEQYTHISLWSLLASPLLIGCDMSQLDDFTLGLLKNSEVIEINQDVLGKQAQRIINNSVYQVWVRDLEDGSKAVGIFNMTQSGQEISVKWDELGLSGPKTVRDVWRQKDINKFDKEFKTFVAPHGVTFVKIK